MGPKPLPAANRPLLALLRQLRLSWRSHVAAISFGFGVYSLALLAGGGYFTVGREMNDFVLFAYVRIGVYLLVLLWWMVSLYSPASALPAAAPEAQAH